MNKELEKWMREDGVKFLRMIGIESGQTVLDFGARVGHYAVPAAIVAGEKGMVYALDKDAKALDELMQIAEAEGLNNIRRVDVSGNVKIPLGGESVDAILLYDVLHLIDDRKVLYKEVYRVLRHLGLLSVYPKHNKLDSPGWGLENMTPEDIISEVEYHGFSFTRKYCGTLSHDDDLNYGCVLNFKRNRNTRGG